ncbi:MAG TPA: DUF4350 domain-containing protein [Euryarchaeota archaeon]|nr:DUF4350 domain-containing protein [Euryarchaeota archaeon]
MRRKLKRGYVAVTILTVAIALLGLCMVAPVISTTTDFSIFNSGWNGTSRLAVSTYTAGKFAPSFVVQSTGTDLEVVQMELTEIELDPSTAALVIIGPTEEYTLAEGEYVGDFVRAGGILLLADDFGTGNTLLEHMGAACRFSNRLAIDLAFQKSAEFSVCFDLEEDPMTSNVTSLLLNYPSTVSLNPSVADGIAWTSVASWMDEDGDRMQDWGEPRGPFCILARESMGDGTLILLSDPSVLINGMREYMSNEIFAENVVEIVSSERETVLFDESHRAYFDPVEITTKFTGSISTNGKVAIVLLSFFFMLWVATDLIDSAFAFSYRKVRNVLARFISIFRREKKAEEEEKGMSIDELVEAVSERHPEWRKGLIRYVLEERERHRKYVERDRR